MWELFSVLHRRRLFLISEFNSQMCKIANDDDVITKENYSYLPVYISFRIFLFRTREPKFSENPLEFSEFSHTSTKDETRREKSDF